MSNTIAIEVAYALPDKQRIIKLDVPEGTTVMQAVIMSQMDSIFEDLTLSEDLKLGVWGKAVTADRALVGPLAWTPQQKAQYDVAFFRGLARDRQAQRVYLAKVRIVETVRSKAPAQLWGGCKDNTNLRKSAGAGTHRSQGGGCS